MINKSNKQWNASKLFRENNDGNLCVDPDIQRGKVWTLKDKSDLIVSMIEEYPIPPFYLENYGEDLSKYEIIDGQQRNDGIVEFMNNNYKLSNDTIVKDKEGYIHNISGKYFNELDEWMIEQIKTFSFTIYYFIGLEREEKEIMFDRLNGGKKLTASDLTNVKVKSKKQFGQILSHKLIDSTTTEATKIKKSNRSLAWKIYSMLYVENTCFLSKQLETDIKDIIVSDEELKQVEDCLDYVLYMYEKLGDNNTEDARIKSKIKKPSHLISCVYFANLCIENNFDKEKFYDIMYKFFDSKMASVDKDYNFTIGSGSASIESIKKRKEALRKLL